MGWSRGDWDKKLPPQPAKKPSVKAKARTRGRDRGMNKTELYYASYLDGQKVAGKVHEWMFEGIKLRLADLTYLTIDFVVIMADGSIELHDTKAWWKKAGKVGITEDASVKMKVAAEQFPWLTIKCVWERDGRWHYKEY
jgi:hypothetical protein